MTLPYTPKAVAQAGWSVVVVTNGRAGTCLHELVESADREFANSPAEILIVGPDWFRLEMKTKTPLRYIDFQDEENRAGWITKKKNLGAFEARYDKLALCHDYVFFEEGWKT